MCADARASGDCRDGCRHPSKAWAVVGTYLHLQGKENKSWAQPPHLSQHVLTGAGRREGVYQVTRMGRSEQSHARASSTEGGFARPVDANIAPHSHPPYSSPAAALMANAVPAWLALR